MKFSNRNQVKKFYQENRIDAFDSVFYGSSTVDNIKVQKDFEDEEHEDCYHLDIADMKTFITHMKNATLAFGKSTGETLYNILKNDHSYFEWLVDEVVMKNEVAAWEFAFNNL